MAVSWYETAESCFTVPSQLMKETAGLSIAISVGKNNMFHGVMSSLWKRTPQADSISGTGVSDCHWLADKLGGNTCKFNAYLVPGSDLVLGLSHWCIKWANRIFPSNLPDFFLGKYPVQPGKIPVAWAIRHHMCPWPRPTWTMHLFSGVATLQPTVVSLCSCV